MLKVTRFLTFFALLTAAYGCASLERMTDNKKVDDPVEIEERTELPNTNEIANDPTAVNPPPPVVDTSSANVVRPRGAGTPVPVTTPASDGSDLSSKGGSPEYYENAPGTPRAYGTTASTPQPYGEPMNSGPSTYQKPPGDQKGLVSPEAPATVMPNTTLPATPEAYQHLEEDAKVNVSPQFAAALTGLWVNAEDDQEVVEFTTDHYSTFYEGELLVQEPMTVHERCPGDCNGGTPMGIPCFTIVGPAGIDCFGVVRLSTTELELKLIGVSDETVVYRRQ